MTNEMQPESYVNPLLTIAVPTYNRATYLRELLSILFAQLVDEKRVELIISDNASSDETPEVISNYQRDGLAVRSIRNAENIGADANFLQCFREARGKYVWIFSDDDVLVQGAIAAILHRLEANDYDLVYVNQFPLRGLYSLQQVRDLSAKEYASAERFAQRINVYFTFISGNIINKDRIRDKTALFFESVGTNLVQLSWTYAALNQFARGLYIEDKLVGARVDNTGGYRLTDVFGTKFKRITEQALQSERVKRRIINGTLQRFWPGILFSTRKSPGGFVNDSEQSKTLTSEFKGNPRYWFFVYPMLALPAPLGAGWFFFIRVLNRIDRALGFVL